MTAAGVGDGSLSAFIQAVHACHATAVINFVGFGVDARCLAVACAKSAAVALLGIYDRFEKRIPGQETEHRTYRTNRVAVRTSASPCQYDEHDKSKGRNDEGGQAFHPHLRFIKSVAVRPFRQICQQIIAPLIDGSEETGSDAPVRAIRFEQRSNRMKAHACNEGHGKHCQHSVTQPFPGGRIAETVFLPLACKPGNDILKYAERADNGAIDASEQQGQCNKQQYHACIQCEQCGEELYFRHPAHPAVQRSGEIEEQERDECKEYNCKCQSDST